MMQYSKRPSHVDKSENNFNCISRHNIKQTEITKEYSGNCREKSEDKLKLPIGYNIEAFASPVCKVERQMATLKSS